MKGRLQIALLATIPMLGISAAGVAATPYIGPYAGGEVLQARLNPKRTDTPDFKPRNDSDLGWKGLVGVRMSPHFAFEAGYTDFGLITAPDVAVNRPLQARTKVFTAFGVGIVPVGRVEMFAKAGPARTESIGAAVRLFSRDHVAVVRVPAAGSIRGCAAACGGMRQGDA